MNNIEKEPISLMAELIKMYSHFVPEFQTVISSSFKAALRKG